MNVIVYANYFDAKKIGGNKTDDLEYYEEDLIEVLDWIIKKKAEKRKKDMELIHKIMYLSSYSYDSKKHIVYLEFVSVRYRDVKKVIDTKTLSECKDKEKEPGQGDEEITCLVVKFSSKNKYDYNAKCYVQNNQNGIALNRICDYLNEKIEKYHKTEKKDNILYKIVTQNIVSSDFLKSLEHTKRIKSVRLTMSQEDLDSSSTKRFSGNSDLNNNVDIVYKPAKKGKSILKDTVKEFFDMYNDTSKKVRKIYVDSKDLDNNPLTFDTEKMKEKKVLDISEDGVKGGLILGELKKKMLQCIENVTF